MVARVIAALDACVFIEAARVPGGLCNVILAFAETGELEVLVAPQVIAEVDANLTSDHQRRRLGRWREFWVVCSQPASEHVDSETAQFLTLMGHAADVPIAGQFDSPR